jgi:hypothetical protein
LYHVSPFDFDSCCVIMRQGNKFMFSSSMTKVAQAKGWWQTGNPFDFTKIFSYGEYFSEGYVCFISSLICYRISLLTLWREQLQQPPHVARPIPRGSLSQTQPRAPPASLFLAVLPRRRRSRPAAPAPALLRHLPRHIRQYLVRAPNRPNSAPFCVLNAFCPAAMT